MSVVYAVTRNRHGNDPPPTVLLHAALCRRQRRQLGAELVDPHTQARHQLDVLQADRRLTRHARMHYVGLDVPTGVAGEPLHRPHLDLDYS
jgi:hypothetical protein